MAQAESETTTSAKATTTKKTETTKNAAKETKVNNVTMVATEIVNVREKADKNSEIEAIVATDEEVIVTAETSDGWYKVTYGDYSGYVMKDYLKKAEVTTTSAAKSETTTAAKKSETKKTTTTKAKTTKSETKKTETKKATTANSNSSVISYTDEEFDMLCYVLLRAEQDRCCKCYYQQSENRQIWKLYKRCSYSAKSVHCNKRLLQWQKQANSEHYRLCKESAERRG